MNSLNWTILLVAIPVWGALAEISIQLRKLVKIAHRMRVEDRTLDLD